MKTKWMKKRYWFNYIYNNTGATVSSARGAQRSRKIFHLVFLIESISLVHHVDYLLCLLPWPQSSPGGSVAWEVIYSLSEVYSRAFTQLGLPDVAGWADLTCGGFVMKTIFQQRQGWPHQAWGEERETAETFSHCKAFNFQSPFFYFVFLCCLILTIAPMR